PTPQGRAAGLARGGLRRGQRACRDRRTELFPQCRWLSDAGAKESAAAGPEIFHAITKVTIEQKQRRTGRRLSPGPWRTGHGVAKNGCGNRGGGGALRDVGRSAGARRIEIPGLRRGVGARSRSATL